MQTSKHPDPFYSGAWEGNEAFCVAAEDRIHRIKKATLAECEYVLAEYKGRLQKTVETATARRIRELNKRYHA